MTIDTHFLIAWGACVLLGLLSGPVGTVLMVQDQATRADAFVSSVLPGIVGCHLVFLWLLDTFAPLPALIGAAFLGIGSAFWLMNQLHRTPGVDASTTVAITLSGMLGIGLVMLSIVTSLDIGGSALVNTILSGSAASLTIQQAWWIGGICLLCLTVLFIARRPIHTVIFQKTSAQVQGLPVRSIQAILMVIVSLTTTLALIVIGPILSVGLLILPGCVCWPWSHRVKVLCLMAMLINSLAITLGLGLSRWIPNLPAGASVVTVLFMMLFLSMLLHRATQTPFFLPPDHSKSGF